MEPQHKTVLVTGGTRGLGLAIVKRLSSDGFHVIATGRQISSELQAVIESGGGGQVSFEALDLIDAKTIIEFSHAYNQKYGAPFGLVNNAAVAHDGVLATMHMSEIIEVIQVNVIGTILLTKHMVRPMLVRRGGRIINISSIIGFTGFNGLSVYGASKAALIGFTKSLARELGRANITVNAIAPGYMPTQMSAGLGTDQLSSIVRRTPLGRLTTPEEVAGTVSFLLGDDATMITGTVVTVDGGSIA